MVIDRVSRRLFGSPILRNDIRGEVAEEIVAMALEPDWQLCGGDWAGCDLKHVETGCRIQVKQSVARQSWHKEDAREPKPRFSIAHKTGRWEEGDRWIAEPGRNADIFIFAWHPRIDAEADHREPEQWEFYIVCEADLPAQKSLSLAAVQALSPAVTFGALPEAVARSAGRAELASPD